MVTRLNKAEISIGDHISASMKFFCSPRRTLMAESAGSVQGFKMALKCPIFLDHRGMHLHLIITTETTGGYLTA